MKYTMLLGTLLLGTLGTAGAQIASTTQYCTPGTSGCTTGSGDVVVKRDGREAMLVERITVSVPSVVAMHLHETSWTVDLNNLANCDCYRAGEHDSKTGVDNVYDIAAVMKATGSTWFGDQARAANNAYSIEGSMYLDPTNAKWIGTKVSSYPGIEYDERTKAVHWKGPIVCFNRKIVEKFTNAPKWNVNISVSNVSTGFPRLVLGDRLPNGKKFVETLYDGVTPKALNFSNTDAGYASSTRGWLDDYILEALVFDGSETAGTKTANVNFKLTGTF